jgi:hypothetical protein
MLSSYEIKALNTLLKAGVHRARYVQPGRSILVVRQSCSCN